MSKQALDYYEEAHRLAHEVAVIMAPRFKDRNIVVCAASLLIAQVILIKLEQHITRDATKELMDLIFEHHWPEEDKERSEAP